LRPPKKRKVNLQTSAKHKQQFTHLSKEIGNSPIGANDIESVRTDDDAAE
jgi:hypothetical protein